MATIRWLLTLAAMAMILRGLGWTVGHNWTWHEAATLSLLLHLAALAVLLMTETADDHHAE